ncbi:hypothetical protein [Halopelagius fulvigenes]|uniref:Uncharacterized protein n=1 Tax=Halopelagius fulvigenes TaxID=1198324 RepID=A0ABD5U2Y7_9EURY
MGNSDPGPNEPLSPYFPSDAPSLPGNGRRWFAILLSAMILSGAIYAFATAFL